MSGAVRALYLQRADEDPVFAVHHPARAPLREASVLICPPFGWEDVCSYRSRRAWAEHLAAEGYSTLRVDLPGSGDSGGAPTDPLRLAGWSAAVGDAAAWLSAAGDGRSVVAIGIGLGGLLICMAVADGAPIAEAVLWATPSRGRTLLRELRAFARMELHTSREAAAPDAGKGRLEAGGFSMSAETTALIEHLDVATLTFPAGRMRRALLLGRDGIAPETRLVEHLERTGAQVRCAPGDGYGAMMAEPQRTRPPLSVFARVDGWLAESFPRSAAAATSGPSRSGRAAQEAPPSSGDAARLAIDGVAIREHALSVEQPFGSLFGILAVAEGAGTAQLGAVVLNAGAIRRIGPGRMWVEVARRWAARGIPTLRLDLEGIGDADGDDSRFTEVAELYVPRMVEQVRAALDVLERDGVAERFVLLGLCSGAYWSFHGALQDPRVSAALMLNPQSLFWDPSRLAIRDLRRAFLGRDSWARLFRGETPAARLADLARKLPAGASAATQRLLSRRERSPGGDQLDDALARLSEADKRAVFIFSGEEPLHEELRREGRLERIAAWQHVAIEMIAGRDHTLRPPAARREAHAALDRALERELEQINPAAADPR